MKKLTAAVPALFLLSFFCACDKNDDPANEELRPLEFQIGFADTRLAVEECLFTHGDEIGVFAAYRPVGDEKPNWEASLIPIYENVKLTFDRYSEKWIADLENMTLPISKTGYAVEFYAYYPYQPEYTYNKTKINMPGFNAGQGHNLDKGFGQADMMTAYKTLTSNETIVPLNFKHQMALLEVVFKSPTGSGAPLISAALEAVRIESREFDLIQLAKEEKELSVNEDGLIYSVGMHLKSNTTVEEGRHVSRFQMAVIPQLMKVSPGAYAIHYVDKNHKPGFIKITSDIQLSLTKGGKHTLTFEQEQ